MTPTAVTSRLGVAEMPERTRSRAEMDADYADRFAIEVPGAHGSARPWAHLILEQTPSGRSAPRLWTLIGVSLGPRPSPDHVQGWRVIADHETWVVLGASTPYLHARAVIEAEDGELSVALFVRYRLRLGAAVWWPISVLHRRGVPVMLLQARRLGGPRRGHLGRLWDVLWSSEELEASMAMQRMITFETTTEGGADRVTEALDRAFEVLAAAQPPGVRLTYWRVRETRRFVALIDLADEGDNPLLEVDAARQLPTLIAEQVEGGYPRPEVIDVIGSYGFDGPSLGDGRP